MKTTTTNYTLNHASIISLRCCALLASCLLTNCAIHSTSETDVDFTNSGSITLSASLPVATSLLAATDSLDHLGAIIGYRQSDVLESSITSDSITSGSLAIGGEIRSCLTKDAFNQTPQEFLASGQIVVAGSLE